MKDKERVKVFTIFPEKDTMSCDSAYALEELQVAVSRYILPFQREKNVLEYNLVDILKNIIKNQPDFIFSLNGNSLDNFGVAARSFALLNIPLVIWFIDNPFYFFEKIEYLKVLSNTIIFVWDRFYLKPLKEKFGKEVFHLPQATNPHRFKEQLLDKKSQEKFSAPLTFVANLDLRKIEVFTAEIRKNFPAFNENSIALCVGRGTELSLKDRTIPTKIILERVLERNNLVIEEEHCRNLIEKIIEYTVSALVRKDFVLSLISSGIKVWGSAEWLKYIPQENYKGETSYFTETVKVFRASLINLNLSRVQQRYSTNQRVFDIPICRGFLISDYKEEMEAYFKIGEEMICFRNLPDLQDKIKYFLNNPLARERIIEKGFSRVMAEHTYTHRMEKIVDYFREYRSQRRTARPEFPLTKEFSEAYFSLGRAYEELNLLPQAIDFYKKTVYSDKGYGKLVEQRLTHISHK